MHTIKDIIKQLIGKSLDAYNKKYTSPINNRIDNIVAQAGTDNTEIVDARIDSAGVSHTTLNNRILAETKMTDEKLIEYSGSNLSVDDTMPGYLENIEIEGNTIQDVDNLEDIRSVGKKVEGQELYEIPILSCGKNLFDGELEVGSINSDTGINSDSSASQSSAIRSAGFIRIKPSTIYTSNITSNIRFIFYDANKVIISSVDKTSFMSPNNCYYVRFRILTTDINTKVQLEEGTVATEYEPYQEDKLTILSPCQIEKVGNVADRIVEKNGVWGVEKNIENKKLEGSEEWRDFTLGSGSVNIVTLAINDNTNNNNVVICDKFKYLPSNEDEEHIRLANIKEHIRVFFNKDKGNSLSEWKAWLKINPIYVKYATNSPQFIPLPHDQQVKLRTFANKTNISFLTEIEGTIKAQVPKSLGATVNTHTTQIDNLNKELDRVKKLEESTVSTVETESDFTVVEQTSNGYFEDVKLEGKTLVNLADKTESKLTTSFKIVEKNIKMIKPNTEYTILFNIKSWDRTVNNNIHLGTTGASKDLYVFSQEIAHQSVGMYIYKWKTKSDLTSCTRIVGIAHNSIQDTTDIEIIILEGDHTQNPPSYFEGLKSVSDGADEIVVSSVNGDGNLFDGELEIGTVNSENGTDQAYHLRCRNKGFIAIKENLNYSIKVPSNYFINRIFYYGSSYNYIYNLSIGSNQRTFTTPSGARYLRFAIGVQGDSNISQTNLVELRNTLELKCGELTTEYTPHQTDKKQLLFYNTETQTWEKPVLREWDSIEKHSDGKYYYHKRSEEMIFDENGEWSKHSTIGDYTSFHTKPSKPFKAHTNLFCTHFNFYTGAWNPANSKEGITLDSNGNIYIQVVNSKLSSQDVEGFKQWLQTNNVTVVYQLAEEKVYECTNIDLITYANETNYIVECGAISPKSTLKVHNNISNIVSLLQKKISLLESNITNYMITQNRLMLISRYNADSVTFKVDYSEAYSVENKMDEDLFNLLYSVIIVGKDNYDYDEMFNIISDYVSWNKITWEHFDILSGLMQLQHDEIANSEEIYRR